MPLWGNKDNAANSDIAALMQVNKSMTAANQTSLFDNTTTGAFFANLKIGQFGVDTNEITADPNGHGYHAGWVLRKEGTGLRAGRVTYETLVASGSIPTTDASDDTNMPDYKLRFTTQATSNSAQTGDVNIVSAAASTPTGATLSYVWQRWNGSAWVNIANTANFWYNVTSPTLVANVAGANANTVRVQVSATGANTITSANATITKLA